MRQLQFALKYIFLTWSNRLVITRLQPIFRPMLEAIAKSVGLKHRAIGQLPETGSRASRHAESPPRITAKTLMSLPTRGKVHMATDNAH